MLQKLKFIGILILIFQNSFSQEGMPVYFDYLTDNYYLLHPSMAGVAACDKVRFTARKQWFDQEDSPALQTLSYNGRFAERSGMGVILFNDKNGYHSQKGAKLSYTHHLMFSRDEIDLNQLSFGINASFSQSQLDETSFLASGDFDPIINGTIVQKASYFNLDIGASYNFLNFYIHGTVHNLLESDRKIYTEFESNNLRRYILNSGYTFGKKDKLLWEPSLMFQFVEQTKEKIIDVNFKAYKYFDFGYIWAGLSYRKSFDNVKFANATFNQSQKLQYITPLLGINYKKLMFAYNYSYLSGTTNFGSSGFHQLTLGIDLFCKREKYDCNCPAHN